MRGYLVAKRILDFVVAGATLILLMPLFVCVAILLRVTGEGEILFRQKRIGLNARPFELWKFATMLKDSPRSGTITARNDTRILPVGRFLRHTKINELPQIINVIKGDMSIVGPRPLTEEAFGYYPEDIRQDVYKCKPGITGIGSLVFRDEESILAKSQKGTKRCYAEDIAPVKARLELWYGQNRSLWVDVKIVLLTAIAILLPAKNLYKAWFVDLPDMPND